MTSDLPKIDHADRTAGGIAFARRNALCALLASTLLGGALGGTLAASAQTLPAEARRSTAAETYRAPINAFVAAQVKQLASADAAAQSAARTALLAPLEGTDITDSFRAVFSEAVGKELLPAAGAKELPTRLNAAVIAARVADRGTAQALRAVTLKLLADDSEPVAVWGIRSARTLASGRTTRIDAEVVAAVAAAATKFGTGTATVEAYRAIIGDLSNVALGTADAVKGIQSIMAARVAAFAAGTGDEPRAEVDAVNFLANTRIWNAPGVQMADRVKTADLLVRLLTTTGSRLEVVAGVGQQQLREVAVATARALRAIGREVASEPIDKAAATVSNNSGGAEVKAAAAAIANAFVGVKGFESVKAN
jgi:hypothetical protein